MRQRVKILLLIISFFFSISFTLNAQTHKFSHYTVKDGLSQSSGLCFFQDSEGLLWIGTQNGLNKFNGYSFESFIHNPNDLNSISDNWIFSIIEDKKGNLWIGTHKGLNKFDKKTGQFTVVEHLSDNSLINNNSVYGLFLDKNGNILINTPPELNILNPETNKVKYYKNTLPLDHAVRDQNIPILQDKEGLVWIASTRGLACFNPQTKKFENFINKQNNRSTISNNYITSLYEDKKGKIWIGTKNGLNKYNKKTKEISNYYSQLNNPNSLSDNNIVSIIEDNNDNLWVGTTNGGLNKLSFSSNGDFKSCLRIIPQSGNVDAIASNTTYSLLIDKSNNLWVSTLAGVDKTDLKRKKFRLYRSTADINSVSLSDNAIFPIFEYKKDILWLGTWGKGLNIYNRQTGKIKYYSENKSHKRYISNDFIHSILKDSKGRMWVGTRDGMNIYNEKDETFTDLNKYFPRADFPSFSNLRIYCMIEDRNGNIVIGTRNGLYFLDMKTLKPKSFVAGGHPDSSISANLIYSLLEDNDGDIWIATTNGLDRYIPDKQVFKHYKSNPDNPNSICDNFVISLCQDSEGFIWIGTNSGVNKLNKKTLNFDYYGANHDFPSNIVYDIVEDNNKDLWFTTGAGLARFDRKANKFTTYNEEDGLQGLEYNLKSCFKADDGEIFVGGINGFNSFYPDSLFGNTFIPPIAITSFVKENDTGKHRIDVSSNEEIILTHDDYAVIIEFAALDFTNPQENLYAYKMEGLTDKRIENGKSRIVQFLNLPQGDYVLTIFGSNSEGVWNKEGTSISIKVLPPWWRSIYAYFAYIIVIIFLIVLFIKLREKQLVYDKKVLERKVQGRTIELNLKNIEIESANKELQSTLNTVSQQNEEITMQRDNIEKQKNELEKLSIVADKTLNSVIIADETGEIEWVNEGFTRLLGISLEEFKETYGSNIYKISLNPRIKKDIEQCVKNKESVVYPTKTIRKDGRELWIQTTLTPIFGADNKLSKFIAIDSDVTKIKKAEEEITKHRDELHLKNKQITDSISYAQRIQSVILPSEKLLSKNVAEHFVIFKPRDVVSGDFYWWTEVNNHTIITAADCTGHGVPGAFMSMLGISFLHEIVNKEATTRPNLILNKLRQEVINALQQKGHKGEQKDGMDMAIISINNETKLLQYSGAYNPLYLIRDNKLQVFDANKMPVSVFLRMDEFTTQEIQLKKDDKLYLFSDGYADQFGGEKEKKFLVTNFKKLLLQNSRLSMSKQKEILNKTLEEWMGETEQIDDIVVLGIKI